MLQNPSHAIKKYGSLGEKNRTFVKAGRPKKIDQLEEKNQTRSQLPPCAKGRKRKFQKAASLSR